MQPAVEDQPGADARRDHHVDHVAEPARGAERDLRQRAEVRVVVDRDRKVEPPRELRAHVEARPVGEDHRVADRPDRSTGPEMPMPTPITSSRPSVVSPRTIVHERRSGVDRSGGRVVDVEVELPFREHRRREIGRGHADVVVAEVDAERRARRRVETEQRRRPSAAGRFGRPRAVPCSTTRPRCWRSATSEVIVVRERPVMRARSLRLAVPCCRNASITRSLFRSRRPSSDPVLVTRQPSPVSAALSRLRS